MKWFLRKITNIAIINFLFLLVAISLISSPKKQDISKVNPTTNLANNVQPAVATSTPVPVRNFLAELKNHNTKSDCWMSYKGHVYNITPVFGTHPGGDSIMLKYCGNDMATGFDTKDKTPAMPHSANAAGLLAQYLIQ